MKSGNIASKEYKPVLTKSYAKNFVNDMATAKNNKDVEKSVERNVNNLIETYYKSNKDYKNYNIVSSYAHSTDGIIEINGGLWGNKKILIEAKKDMNFSGKKEDVAKTLCQVIYYLKTIEQAGENIPDVVICADNDEIFAIPSSLLLKYLKNDYDWSIAPSNAANENTDLLNSLQSDKNIKPFIKVIDENFDVDHFCFVVDNYLNDSEPEKIAITVTNLQTLFNNFHWEVFGGEHIVSNKVQMDVFISGLKGSDDIYPHPKKSNVLVLNNKEIICDSEAFVDFWNYYDSDNYSLDELKNITEIADILIEETDRRFSGDFWTPKIWVDEAHRMIEKTLGEDWKDKYIVWDPAAGSKNLTRDYHFSKGLYSSTLFEEELNIASDYNPEGVSFQYDFLNDDIDLHYQIADGGLIDINAVADQFKLPADLVKQLLNNEPIVFFGNPPYGQATDQDGAKKKGIATTEIAQQMNNLGHARLELYTQFIYRVQLLAKVFNYTKDFFFFFFFNKGFLTSPNFSRFTVNLKNQFEYKDGFMLNAGEFQGTSSAWGIIFSGWEIKNHEKEYESQEELLFNVLQSDKEKTEISKLTEWTARTIEKKNSMTSYIPINKNKEFDLNLPTTKNGFETAPKNYVKLIKESIGYFHNAGMNIQFSEKYIGMYSMGFANAHGNIITKENFDKAATVFSIRRSIQEKIAKQKLLWVRDKDVFKKPSDSLANDKDFINDCVIYSLFDRQSNQTSLRSYEYNGQKHRVINEFFPFEKQFIKDLAIENNNLEVQKDISVEHSERHVCELLNNETLTKEAQDLLNTVKKIYELSFKYRRDYDKNSRYHLNSWDAGWKQIYNLCFSTFADFEAKNDSELQNIYEQFKTQRTALGSKIAEKAEQDGVI